MAKKTPKKTEKPKTGDVLATRASLNRNIHEIEIRPSSHAPKAIALRDSAKALVVSDKGSHTAGLTLLRDSKAIGRKIADDWKAMKGPLTELLTHVRDLERGELAPAQEAVALIEQKVGAYEREETRRATERQDAERKEAERVAAETRERELEQAELAALKAEAAAEGLSEREADFAESVAQGVDSMVAAEGAGYKDVVKQSARLLNTPKILAAIAGIRAAALIREQAEAKREQPIVADVPDVRPELGAVSGVSKRTYYSCESADLPAMLAAFTRGEISAEAFAPNMVFLNREASRIKDAVLFASIYPGCVLTSRDSHAG